MGGQIVQHKTCYYKSIAKEYFISFYQTVKSNYSYKNFIIEVSVSKCGESETKGGYITVTTAGNICFSNNNITNNKCSYFSSHYSVVDLNSSTFKFSTFRENNQTDSRSLCFNSFSKPLYQTVSYCNVIGNKCGTDNNQVLFNCQYKTYVDHCIFRNNTAKYMFRQEHQGYTLTISDSYVESNSATGVIVTFTNLKENYDFNHFSHFYKDNCLVDQKVISNTHKIAPYHIPDHYHPRRR